VAAVIGYWDRWMECFPSLSALAEASPDDVNLAWQGLGFYRRARNLHAGAKDVVARFGGKLPSTVEELKSIPGIGPYTAGAIASIAFGQSEALVDGNVVRVLSRLRALEVDAKSPALAKTTWKLARSIVPTSHPGDFNEGLMELGATVCTPQSPQCEICPVQSLCAGYSNGIYALATLQGDQETLQGDQPSPAQGEVGRWVCSKYPSKPSTRAKVPRERVGVVVIEHHPSTSLLHTRFLLLRSTTPTQRSGGLLSGQWAPLAFPLEGSAGLPIDGDASTKRKRTTGCTHSPRCIPILWAALCIV
jgi:adenine-specific DNA glycosylase